VGDQKKRPPVFTSGRTGYCVDVLDEILNQTEKSSEESI